MKIKPITWASLAFMFLGIFLACWAITLPFLGLAFILLYVIVMIVQVSKEKKQKFCEDCKIQYDFEEGVEYNEISRKLKNYHVNPESDKKQVEEKLWYTVRFKCTCQNCNKSKTFTKKIYGGCEYNTGEGELLDVEDAIEQWYAVPGLEINTQKSVVSGFIIGFVGIVLSIVLQLLPSPSDLGIKHYDTLKEEDFYGTYYGVNEQYTEIQLHISDRAITMTEKPLVRGGSSRTYDSQEYIFYTADYVKENGKEPGFEIYGVLLLKTGYNNMAYWLYITDITDGNAKFKLGYDNGSFVELTTTEKTVKDMINDPEDYYGKYRYSEGNSVNVKESGSTLWLNGEEKYVYACVYANKEMLRYFGVNVGEEGILVFVDETNFYWFIFDGKDLLLNNTNKFVKTN